MGNHASLWGSSGEGAVAFPMTRQRICSKVCGVHVGRQADHFEVSISCNTKSPVGVLSRNVAVGNGISMIPELRLIPSEAGTPGEADTRSKPGPGPPVFPVTNSEEG